MQNTSTHDPGLRPLMTSANMFRKNGKPTSCEPCRISKVRCDHTTPICQRCQKRGIVDKCYYHEAPLTRPGSKNRNKVTKPQTMITPRVNVARRRASDPENHFIHQDFLDEKGSNSGTTIQNAYLGSTSFLSVFKETPPGFSSCSIITPQLDLARWGYDAAHTQLVLARFLSAFDLYDELIMRYYESCLLSLLPMRLVIDPLRATKAYLDSGGWLRESRRCELYAKVTQNTAKSLQFSGTSVEDFTSLFSEGNLRWEFVGVICSLAGLSAISEPFYSTGLPSQKRLVDKEAFSKEMAAASNSCLQLCRRYDNSNDLMIWLQYIYGVLASEVLGDTSHHVYAVLGNMITDVYGMGLHRYKSSDADVPFFLAEVRKRLVAAIYRHDKNISTLLGRPPRLLYRYCDASLPLDIDDDELFLQGSALEAALQKLTPDGWNSGKEAEGQIRAVTVIRLRYFSSVLREKVLKLSLGRRGPTFSKDLQETYQECKQMWDKVPLWFYYRPNCWELWSPIVCIIERIRCRENEAPVKDLLDTSMQAVSAVIEFTKHGEKNGSKFWQHFSWIFLLYALPTAGVLATELHRCTITEIPLTSTASRSEVIRNLSTIVSWFDFPDLSLNVNHKTCVEVSKAINKLLDDTLNYQPGSCQRQKEVIETVAEQISTPDKPGEDLNLIATDPRPHDLSAQLLHSEPFGNDLTNGISIGTGESFLTWLDELGMDASIPEFLL